MEIFQVAQCATSQPPVVSIPAIGSVRGAQMTSAAGKVFFAFRGIPYAKAPIGELRFSVRSFRNVDPTTYYYIINIKMIGSC